MYFQCIANKNKREVLFWQVQKTLTTQSHFIARQLLFYLSNLRTIENKKVGCADSILSGRLSCYSGNIAVDISYIKKMRFGVCL